MATLEYDAPEQLHLDAERLEQAYKLLADWTDGENAPVPGGAIMVGRHGRAVRPRFFGRQGPEADAAPIRDDAVFLLASISKPVTYTGAMLLVERGELNLTDHVTRYLPDFAAHHKEDTLVLHLFTHTSGMPDMLENNVELRAQHAPLSRFIEGAQRDAVPLFPPGTDLSYQSMGTLTVAAIVQKITGQPIAEFLKRELFDPLGMDATRLGSQGLDRRRIARVETPPHLPGTDYDWNSRYWHELGVPWGGLFSTPDDFATFCRMLLDGGRHGDRQLLSPRTVARMTTNRLDDLPDLPESIRRAEPWGLGWRLNHPGTSGSFGDLLGPRTFGHTGATGTMVWIDPEVDGYCILFTTALRSAAPWRLVSLSNAVASAFRPG